MNFIPKLSLREIYPPLAGQINLNACHDPDCGNHGVPADFLVPRVFGPNAQARAAKAGSNSGALGFGKYKLKKTAGAEYRRTSTVLEYDGDPHCWMDRKNVSCQFDSGAGPCGTKFELLSNRHLVDEIARLRSANGVFVGPECGACGRAYLDAPAEFVLDGVENAPGTGRGKAGATSKARNGSRATPKDGSAPSRVRLIHKPCEGRPGARISASLDHRRQRKTSDNVAILMALVNGAGIAKIVRMLSPSGSGRDCGFGRVYDRIFWLEKTLLAFERAQLARWKAEREASGETIRHHLAHDDIVLTINWETSDDRRLTKLNCAATADVRSGYVFRLDVDFDPTVDPVSLFERSFVDPVGGLINLRKAYQQGSPSSFTAPLMEFQRPTGRFEEDHLFAAATHKLSLFRGEVIERMPSGTAAQQAEKAAAIADLDLRIARIKFINDGYFNLDESVRNSRSSFSGGMTRPVYTEAAHFALLREMLPAGHIRLITEQEGSLPGVLPHIFAEEIAQDRFRWIAMTFDKEVKKPEMQSRIAAFKTDFDTYLTNLRASVPLIEAGMTNGQRLRAFIADNMETAVKTDRFGTTSPFPSSNFEQAFMPQIWIRSPIQTAGEINKVVGFPLMRAARRRELKGIPFDGQITRAPTREAMAYHIWSATLQPVSTFFNALRERLSFARRAGGRSSRSGGSYINGAAFNPRMLIAVLNIFRIYYNWFEPRQYVAPWLEDGGAVAVPSGEVMKRIPGTDQSVPMRTKGARRPVLRTPAMRIGIQEVRNDRDGKLVVPSLHRVLYRPWLYWGTPVWDKFENPKLDRRSTRHSQANGAKRKVKP